MTDQLNPTPPNLPFERGNFGIRSRLIRLIRSLKIPASREGALGVGSPGDDMVLEVAVNGGADTLVTFNPRHFAGAAERFGLVLSDAQGILRELRKRR